MGLPSQRWQAWSFCRTMMFWRFTLQIRRAVIWLPGVPLADAAKGLSLQAVASGGDAGTGGMQGL